MKKFTWKKLKTVGAGVGCALLGAAVVTAAYEYTGKRETPFRYFASHHASCSTHKNDDSKLNLRQINASNNRIMVNKADKATITSTINSSERNIELNQAIYQATTLCENVCNRYGLPGLAVAVSVNGKVVWEEGFGYGDVEKRVPMNSKMIMRIASISKSMTMAMLGKLMDKGLIDLDVPIQTYLPKFPIKIVDGKQVTITTRHLLSHLSGIRHYTKKDNEDEKGTKEMSLKEYYIKDHYDSVEKSLQLFQDDELFHEPGTKFLYTTHGWTVVAAIIESIVKIPFEKYSKLAFDEWGLKNTYLDEHKPLIYNRASYYDRDKDGVLHNSPYVDNSYKWAGGGFLSNTTDLLQFIHILLYSWQHRKTNDELSNRPYLSKETIKKIWTGDPRSIITFLGAPTDRLYGLGFKVDDVFQKCVFCKKDELMTIFHGGAAVGASSILLAKFPKNIEQCSNDTRLTKDSKNDVIKGVVVVMITNLTNVGLLATANEIGGLFKPLM